MATAAQIALAAKRAADPSYQRAAANAAKAGDTVSLSRLSAQGVTTATIKAVTTGSSAAATVINQALTQGGSTKMGAYESFDEALGGILPGGVPINAGVLTSVGTAAKYGTVAAGATLLATNYSNIDKALGGILPGGVAGSDYALGGRYIGRKKIRKYNYTNMKALKRADKRIDGFIKLTRKVVSSVGYTIKRKGAN